MIVDFVAEVALLMKNLFCKEKTFPVIYFTIEPCFRDIRYVITHCFACITTNTFAVYDKWLYSQELCTTLTFVMVYLKSLRKKNKSRNCKVLMSALIYMWSCIIGF